MNGAAGKGHGRAGAGQPGLLMVPHGGGVRSPVPALPRTRPFTSWPRWAAGMTAWTIGL
jgi:hypothetical protein